jgi:hypothetical protein
LYPIKPTSVVEAKENVNKKMVQFQFVKPTTIFTFTFPNATAFLLPQKKSPPAKET